MRRFAARRALVVLALVVVVLAAVILFASSQRFTRSTAASESGQPRLHVQVPVAHYVIAARYEDAATVALAACVDWFGPIAAGDLRIAPDVEWLAPVRRFSVEDAVAEATAEAYWSERLKHSGGDPIIAGLGSYTRARMMESSFREERVDHSTLAAAAADRDPASHRASLAFHTVERHYGWSVMQLVLASLHPGEDELLDQLETELAKHSGQDVSWLLPEAFDASQVYDYGIARLESAPMDGQPGRYRTVVELRRNGNAMFSGTAQAASNGFEAGRALRLRVAFVDESTIEEFWDGRDASKTYVFASAAMAERAVLDPDEVLVLDVNPQDNVQVIGRQ
jgi:hypothetical protein